MARIARPFLVAPSIFSHTGEILAEENSKVILGMCARVRARVRACGCACVWVCVRVRTYLYVLSVCACVSQIIFNIPFCI
jgi:hypothetical protein